MRPTAKITAPLIFTLAAFSTSIFLAGRPLTVDDANVNEVGAGQLETWHARQADGVNVWTVAPAYGLMEGVEIGASWSRDIREKGRVPSCRHCPLPAALARRFSAALARDITSAAALQRCARS